MFSSTLFQKIRTYHWAQFCVPHLMRQCKFYVPIFFSNCRNPALKPRSRINPVASRGQANAAPYLSLLTVGLTWREVSLVWNIIFSKFFKQLLNIHFSFFPVKSSATSIGLNAPDFDSSYRFQNFWWGGGGGVPPQVPPSATGLC